MQQRKLGDGRFFLVLDPGDELHAELKSLAEREQLAAAMITGIGAVGELELGYFAIPQRDYDRRTYREALEVIALNGNLGWHDGKPMCHLHGVFSGPDMAAFGGHVFRAVCSVTLEIFVTAFATTFERFRDERFRLALMRL